MQLAKVCLIAYNKDRKREAKASPKHLPTLRKGDGVAMLNLRSFAKWVRGILDSEEAYNLPEDVYNDVIPSGVHDFCRFDREY